jgi:hypothetical protein
MYKKDGLWVFHTGAPLSQDVVEETLRRVRKERERAILGKQR